jgi:DnaJ-domain-containing protein 1
MEYQFEEDDDFCTAQESCEAIPDLETNRSESAGLFANGLLGDDSDPDPLFFEESWTLGVAAAVEHFQQRQKKQRERERQSRADRELDSLGAQFFVEERAWCEEHLPWAQAAQPEGRRDAAWPLQVPEESSAQMEGQALREWDRFVWDDSRPETTHSMTLQRACRLLGVSAGSTREQIKAAYHQMASQWHPDRLQNRTEEMREFATDQMAAINEAYSVVRTGLAQESD